MFKLVWETVRRSEYVIVLLTIGFMICAVPLMDGFSFANRLVDVSILLTLIGSVYSISHRRKHFYISLGLLVLWVLSYVWYLFQHGAPALMLSNLIAIAFYSHFSMVLLFRVLQYRSVSFDTIAGALAVYLLIGVIGALVFSTIYLFDPGAISVKPELLKTETDPRRLDVFTYFSFVTLTTLGYGDITPVSTLARVQTYMEALMGQVYITVLIARLVSLEVSNDRNRTDSE